MTVGGPSKPTKQISEYWSGHLGVSTVRICLFTNPSRIGAGTLAAANSKKVGSGHGWCFQLYALTGVVNYSSTNDRGLNSYVFNVIGRNR